MAQVPLLSLTEFQSATLDADQLSLEDVEYLTHHFPHQIRITPTSIYSSASRPAGWQIQPQGVAGLIGLPSGQTLEITPKVPVSQLIHMLGIVYPASRPRQLPINAQAEKRVTDQIFSMLVEWFIDETEQIIEQGFYLTFDSQSTVSNVVQGRVDPNWLAAHPQTPLVRSETSHLTPDNRFNLILSTTLNLLLDQRATYIDPTLGERLDQLKHKLPNTRQTDPTAMLAEISYGINEARYEASHALCRLLAHGLLPTQTSGDLPFRSFLIEMAPLFEQFVVRWLMGHLPKRVRVVPQKRKRLEATQTRYIAADILITDASTGQPLIVLDTKYKGNNRPDLNDLYQVTFYAAEFGVTQAGLVYPHSEIDHLAGTSRGIQYQSLSFDLNQSIDQAGQAFLSQLLSKLKVLF